MSDADHPQWGTPLTPGARRLMLLGAGELGREVVIEAQRLGLEVMAVDRYAHAPAMAVAHHARVIDMTDGNALRRLIAEFRPHQVIPEIEAIATTTLVELEAEGLHVVPSARAVALTMDRMGIRRLAAEELGLPTSPYRFVSDYREVQQAVADLGLPVVIKPVMSSSGKGQSVVRTAAELPAAYELASHGGRVGGGRLIIEGFIEFDSEITLLTIAHRHGIDFCPPIGHLQIAGDYRESWQPAALAADLLGRCQDCARAVVGALGGHGLYGVEFFIRGDSYYFSEVSPRPHDTGLVTLATQAQSQFALHLRALLGLPVHAPTLHRPGASAAFVVHGEVAAPHYAGISQALAEPDVRIQLFGKPAVHGYRRLGVAVSLADSVDSARDRARRAAAALRLVDTILR